MRSNYPVFVSLAAALILAGCSVVGIRTGYEEPSYSVVDRIGDDLEIRTYAPRLAASATVDETEENAGRNQAFRILFDYISGANIGSAEIAMTVPVEVPSAGEKVAMTVPVETSANVEGRTTMRFFLPSEFTVATAPVPKDARVQIEELPETTEAALRFTGLGSLSSLRERRAELLRALDGSGWSVKGEPTTLFYDPPWTIPFLRRNEVLVPVARNKNFTDG
ncbi:MAG: heme-binding protein [Pseudomonadota bacterium]